MRTSWRTAWQAQDIVVYRDDVEVDRVPASSIERVVLVHRGSGESPGDLMFAVVELAQDCLLFPADTGFAGRVNFERQAFWAERACIYWASEANASLPMRLRRGLFGLGAPQFARMPRTEFAPLLDRWVLEGPQTWEQRKWHRIERSRPFARTDDESRLRA